MTTAVFSLALLLSTLVQTPTASPKPKSQLIKEKQTSEATTKKKGANDEVVAATASVSSTPAPEPCTRTIEEAVSPPVVVSCIHPQADKEFKHVIVMNNPLERGDNLTVPIAGLREWAKDNTHDPHALRLFLAGHLLPKDEPSAVMVDQGYINFQLTTLSGGSDADERRAWILILSEARRHRNGSISVSVGLPKDLQALSSDAFTRLRVYPWYSPFVFVLLPLMFFSVLVLGWRSDLLRNVTLGRPPAPGRAPFSLGRVQMAWWFCLVIAAYVYISLITKEINIITATALTLIGISAGTGLASVFVDKQKITDEENQKISLQSERSVVQARIAALNAANPAAGSPEALELHDREKRLAEIGALLAKFPAVRVIPASKGFLDILKDGEGLSFHRFQIAVWTIVLGLVFVKSAFLDLVMPEFDATLLALMGISSGTYIGFKFPEK